MILFYSERHVYAYMFIQGLRAFLDSDVGHLYLSDDAPQPDPDLLIIDGRDIHPQRLKKIIRLCGQCPVILLSDGQYNCDAVTSQLSLTTSIKDVVEISRLVLSKSVVKQRKLLSDIEELLAVGLIQGQSNIQIARGCDLPISTVKYHLQNIYSKLDVNNRTQAALKLQETPL